MRINTDTQRNFLSLKDSLGNLVSLTFNLFIPLESTATEIIARFSQEVFSNDGIYNLNVTIYDQAGNSATASTSFTLDRSGPKITEVNPKRGSTLVIGPQSIWAKVKDETLGTYTYEKSRNGKTWTLTLQVRGYIWTNGIYTVRIKVSDKLDNTTKET